VKQRNEDRRDAVIAAGQKGKSAVQAKMAPVSHAVTLTQDEEIASLIKEKRRLEYTIESLARRLEELNERLDKKGKPE
jgi:hypothetical protein